MTEILIQLGKQLRGPFTDNWWDVAKRYEAVFRCRIEVDRWKNLK